MPDRDVAVVSEPARLKVPLLSALVLIFVGEALKYIHHDTRVRLHLVDCDILRFFVLEDLRHEVFSICHCVHTSVGSMLAG